MNDSAPRLAIRDVLRLATAKGSKVQKAGNGFVTRCPAHDDNRASLSIGSLDNGGVGLKCHAGCGAASIAQAFGFELYQLSPDKPEPFRSNGNGSGPAIVSAHDYVDENGSVLFQAIRKEGKQFSQRRPDGNGGWIWNLDGVRRVPYRLPELIEEVALGKTVFIVEGEKDADNLRALGMPATTNSGGAGKWRDEYGVHLKGANVVVLPDNDEPGRIHAAHVERALTGIAASVRTVALPGLPEKGDVSDWIAGGGTTEKLHELLTVQKEGGLPLPIRAIDVKDEDQTIRFIFRDFAIAGDYGLIVGEDGQYKSTVMIHFAGATAAGGMVFNHYQVDEPGPVLFISGEDPAGIIVNRLRAFCHGHGWNEKTVLGNVHVLCVSGEDLTEDQWRAHLVAIIERLGIRLVLLDPLRDLVPGEENSSTDMKPFNDVARALSKPTGATVFAGHHASKGAERSKADRVRGSGGIRGASRRTLFIEDMSEEKAIKIESVKFSRMPKPAPFMVRRFIESDPANPAMWTLARFEHATAYAVEFDKAETFIRDLLANGMEMNSSEIREAAKKKVGGVAINSAIKNLEMRRRISHREGPNNSKIWRWAEPVSDSRQADRHPEMPVGQADRLSDNRKSPPLSLSVPIGDRQADRAGSSRQASFADEVVA